MSKVIVFDVDDTLLDFTACSKIALRTACARAGIPFTDRLYDTFVSCNEKFWKQIEQGELTLAQLWKIRWNTIFSLLDIQADGEAFETFFHGSLDDTHETMPGARQVLTVLSADHVLYAASNGRQKQQEHRLHLAGLDTCLAGIITSELAGANKPDPVFFDCLMDRIRQDNEDIRPEDVLLVGDSLSADIEGARSYGMKTLWFRKDGREGCGCSRLEEIIPWLNEM